MQTKFHLLYVPSSLLILHEQVKRYMEKFLSGRQFLLRILALELTANRSTGHGMSIYSFFTTDFSLSRVLVAIVPFDMDVFIFMHLFSHTFLVLADMQRMELSLVPRMCLRTRVKKPAEGRSGPGPFSYLPCIGAIYTISDLMCLRS